MSDILADARQWLDTHGRLENIGTHGEECHRWHLPCLVTRLAAEIARLREENETLRDHWPTFWKPLPVVVKEVQ